MEKKKYIKENVVVEVFDLPKPSASVDAFKTMKKVKGEVLAGEARTFYIITNK